MKQRLHLSGLGCAKVPMKKSWFANLSLRSVGLNHESETNYVRLVSKLVTILSFVCVVCLVWVFFSTVHFAHEQSVYQACTVLQPVILAVLGGGGWLSVVAFLGYFFARMWKHIPSTLHAHGVQSPDQLCCVTVPVGILQHSLPALHAA